MAQCTQSIGHARWIWIRRSLPREELLCTVRSVFLHSERQFQSLPERFGDADGRASNDPWKASCQQKIFLGQSSICFLGSARIDMFSCVHPQSAILQFWTICQMWAWEAVRKYLNFQFLRLGWDFRCLIFWLEKHVALSPSLKVFGVGSLQFLHVSKFCQVQILHTTQALPRRWFLTSRSLYVA